MGWEMLRLKNMGRPLQGWDEFLDDDDDDDVVIMMILGYIVNIAPRILIS